MHGETHDFITLCTVAGGHLKNSGVGWGAGLVKEYLVYEKFKPIYTQQRNYQKILDVGSLDINGSQRYFNFLGHPPYWLEIVSNTQSYLGVDLMEGKGVDVVMNSHKLKFEKETFDLVICVNMLEHDSNYKKTIKELLRVAQKGADIAIVCSNEKHEEHQQLGGGSEDYGNIKLADLVAELKKYKVNKLVTFEIGGDNFAYINK